MDARDPEVHLRMLTSDDAPWMVVLDRETARTLAVPFGWEEEKLAAELDEGVWATEDRWGWAIVVDGTPAGFALVSGLTGPDARMHLRVAPTHRGRGVGREVLRQLADHHFTASEGLNRLVGRAHEQNVPMQRAFNAAGFRMEARYRDSIRQADGRFASEWGYALTRADWRAGRHRADDLGYDLHGLVFEVDTVLEGADEADPQLEVRFLQEGRRALARYAGGDLTGGELAGIVVGDVFVYRFVHDLEGRRGPHVITGGGRARIQRRQDGRLEVVADWSDDLGHHGKVFLVERRSAVSPGGPA